MGRAKPGRKPKPAPVGDFTDAIRAGDDWRAVPALRTANDRWDKAAPDTRLRDRVRALHTGGYVDDRGAEALRRYETMYEACAYEHTRSCLDRTPPSGNVGAPPAVAMARSQFAQVRNACPPVPLMFVHAVLYPEHRGDGVLDTAERLISGDREHRAGMARRHIACVALCLAVAMKIGG